LITHKSCNSFINSVSVIDPILCDKEGNSSGDHFAVMLDTTLTRPNSGSYTANKRLWHSVSPADEEKSIEQILRCHDLKNLTAIESTSVYN